MDISYLLWLQALREQADPALEAIFNVVTRVGEGPALVAITLIVYWCVDRRVGITVAAGFSLGLFVNQLIKNTVCCYRPWIRDARVRPSGAALPAATGYSFPSGHTVSTTTVAGGLAWQYRRRHALVALAALAIVAVGFSRNFLGVHTPQDVVVGMAVSLASIACANALVRLLDAHPRRGGALVLVALALTGAYLAYVTLKPYPIDYDAAGAVLVDPVAMQTDCYQAAGAFAGLAVAWWGERRLVGFSVDADLSRRERVARAVVGVVLVALAYLACKLALGTLDERWADFVKGATLMVVGIAIVPATFDTISRVMAPQARMA